MCRPLCMISTDTNRSPGCFSPDTQLYIYPDTEELGFLAYDLKTGQAVDDFQAGGLLETDSALPTLSSLVQDRYRQAAFLFNGQWLVGVGSGELNLWNVETRILAAKISIGRSLSVKWIPI